MTEEGMVEGGLDEPDELEPAQGSLDLASPEDRATVADWEAAAAAVLRKAKRLGDDDADALVWEKLTRTTLDGIELTPLGTPDLLGGPGDQRPADPPGRLGRARAGARRRPEARPRGGDRRPRGRRDQPVAAGERRHRPRTSCSRASCSTSRRSSSMESTPRRSSRTPATASCTPRRTWVCRRARPPPTGPDRVAGRCPRPSSSTRPRSTTVGASDVQELGWSMAAGATYLRTLTDAGLDVDRAAAWWSSGTPPPTSSSRPSPSCAPPADCGRGSSS